MAPRMVWCCHPVASAICSTVAPSGRLSSSIICACLVPVRGVGFGLRSLAAGAARLAFALPLAGFVLAGVAATSAFVAGAGAPTALSVSADVGAVSVAAGASSSSASTPIAAMPSLVMTARSGPPSPPRTRIRPRLRRLSITLLRAPPLSVRLSGSGRTERSARWAAALIITSWVSLSLVIGRISGWRRAPLLSYGPEPRRRLPRGAGAEIAPLLGVLALVEGLVGDALEQLGVVRQALGVAPGDLVGAVAEVVV